MLDFKAKMHQIQFRLPRWGSLQRSADPLAGLKGPTSKGRVGEEWGKAGERKGGRGREGREREGIGAPSYC